MSELQHPQARAFEEVAALYERARPRYPRASVEWLANQLGIGPATSVVDLGAGTGKLTREWVERGARTIAVEPGPEMLAQLEGEVPQAEPILAAAESLPLGDASVDAVTCGQSFHWFRHEEAVPEIHRVLRPRGGLGLIWNERDREDAVQQEITELLRPLVPPGRPPPHSWADVLGGHALFGPLESHTERFVDRLSADELVARIGSISFVAAAEASERVVLQERLDDLARRVGDVVPFAYVTQAYVTFAVRARREGRRPRRRQGRNPR